MKKARTKTAKKNPTKVAAAKKAWETKRANAAAKPAKKAPAKKAAKAPAKDSAKSAAAKKAWKTKRANAKKVPAKVSVQALKAAAKAPAKDPVKAAAAKKAWVTKRANAAKAAKKAPTKAKKTTKPKATKEAGRPKKAKAGRPKKVTANSIVSFSQIAEVSGISLKKLRNTAKRKKLPVVVANDSFYGIPQDKIPLLVAEVKANELSADKLEIIQKDEIWFEELRQELDLTIKQLVTRCKANGVHPVNRCAELSFTSHYRRAIRKEDAEKLRSLYAPVNIEEVKKLIQVGLS